MWSQEQALNQQLTDTVQRYESKIRDMLNMTATSQDSRDHSFQLSTKLTLINLDMQNELKTTRDHIRDYEDNLSKLPTREMTDKLLQEKEGTDR